MADLPSGLTSNMTDNGFNRLYIVLNENSINTVRKTEMLEMRALRPILIIVYRYTSTAKSPVIPFLPICTMFSERQIIMQTSSLPRPSWSALLVAPPFLEDPVTVSRLDHEVFVPNQS